MENSEVLIRAEHVSKKFCRSLKRSLWYGVQDVTSAVLPWKREKGALSKPGHREFRASELRKDEFWAVRDVSFEVRRGECLGLIGHNGAGKSTLLKMLNSLIRPDIGRITIKGRVGALIELSAGFNPILTGRENIYNQTALLGFSKKETHAKFDAIVDFSELGEFLDAPVQNYSSGMRVRLGFAIAAQMEPDVLLIDEVLAVGDVGFRFKCINRMSELMKRSAVIFVSHTMPQILRVCNNVMHLKHGLVGYHGPELARGVGEYYGSVSAQPRTVAGSGGVEVVELRLSTSGDECPIGGIVDADYGNPIDIRIVLRIAADIDAAAVQVLFWNREMVPVLDVLGPSLSGYIVRNSTDGKLTLDLHIDSLVLNAGAHFISIIASSPDLSTHFLRLDAAATVNIHAHAATGAVSVIPGTWSTVEDTALSAQVERERH